MKNLVSVIIPTYKRSDMICRTINSVLEQSYKNIEIIVVDDNNDNDEFRIKTEERLSTYIKNNSIIYIKHKKNSGGCAARNTGLEHSNGEYICFLDDDDIIYKDKIKEQVEFLRKNKQFGIVYCAREVNNSIHSPKIEGDISYNLLSGNSIIITIMLMIRRESIGKVLWNTKLKRNQEAGFLLDIINKNNIKVGRMDNVLCKSDMSDRSNALNAKKNEEELLRYLDEYDYVISKLSKDDENIKNKIYAARYKGIFLSYLKVKDIKNVIKSLNKGVSYSFSTFVIELLKYFGLRLIGRKKDYYDIKKNRN